MLVGCATRNSGLDSSQQIGHGGAATPDMRAGGEPRVAEGDLAAITERGKYLCKLERIMQLGHERGLPRAGLVSNATLLPVSGLDGSGGSGELTFYRWDDGTEVSLLRAESSRRWLVVPILLQPERVLENEQFADSPEPGSAKHAVVTAVLKSASAAHVRWKGGNWRMHAVREHFKEAGRSRWQTKVYLMSSKPGAPDVEVTVADATRRKEAEVMAVVARTVVGEDKKLGSDSTELSQHSPGPIAVCRALQARSYQVPGVQQVAVVGSSGTNWSIDTVSGKIEVLVFGDEAGPSSPGVAPQRP